MVPIHRKRCPQCGGGMRPAPQRRPAEPPRIQAEPERPPMPQPVYSADVRDRINPSLRSLLRY